MRVFLVSYFWIILLSNSLLSQQQEYLWPTDASNHLTSTFGETRAAHYHSGLDIKTWGKEGYKVFASKDGVVFRIGISAEGYGKVIYLKHPDNTFTVYAHLQRFNETLQNYIDSIRIKDYTFEIDLNVEHINFTVSQGDVIGFTGSTGVGPPHLHFETRDSTDNPFNALSTNLKVQDTISPTISALMVFPLSDSSTIRNSVFPQLYYPSKNGNGEIDFGTIEANGPIGLTVSTYDEANGVTNKYAPFQLTLLLKLDTLFHEELSKFRFDEDEIMFTDRLPAYRATRRSYQTLFKKDGPVNPFYKSVKPETIIQPHDSLEKYTLIITDYYGNETRAKLSIQKSDGINTTQSIHEKLPLWNWYWTENWAFDGTRIHKLDTFISGHIWNEHRTQFIDSLDNELVLWSRFNPESSFNLLTPDKNLNVHFNKNTFFDKLTVAAFTGNLDGLPYISLQPTMIPARKEFTIEYYLGDYFELNQHYKLFRYDRIRDRISYVDSKLVGRTIHAYPSDLGEFVVIADNEAPTLEKPSLVQTNNGKWFITIKARDNLTGIDYKKSQIFVNSIQGIVEFDNEEDLLTYVHPEFVPKSENIITVRIYDKSGNLFTTSYKL